MIARTWPYGTKLPVLVEHGTKDFLVVTYDHGYKKEGFILIKRNMGEIPAEGSNGFITFKQGGPTGGYWEFSKS